jgi:hypothetical protein
MQYHRPSETLLPCSGWERVLPSRYSHRQIVEDRVRRDTSQQDRLDFETTRLTVEFFRFTRIHGAILRKVRIMVKPNGRLVLVSCTHCCAFTSSLSTRWSSWALHFPFGLGDLILERASRLYAFSGYHNRTSLPSCAIGMTTGTQEVRPSRSSRTKDSPLQISCAHSR